MNSQDNVVKGMAAGVCAFFLFAVMNVFAKLLSENHHIIEIVFYRNIIATLPFLFMFFVLQKRAFLKINQAPVGIFARALLGTISLGLTFAAFAYMPMADATTFLFTSSLIIPILGVFILKEQVGIYRWSAVFIGFIGVLIMLQPGGGAVNYIGATIALSAACMHAGLQILLRFLGRTEKPETITFYFVFIGTIISAIPMPFVFTMPTINDIPLLLGVGLSGVLAQYLLSIAFGNAPAAIVTVFNYSGLIWATAFGWFIWNDWPTLAVWIGGAIIISSNIFIVFRESRKRKLSGERIRAKF
jgi:drug/metabolite transporter (DMT)-like permease